MPHYAPTPLLDAATIASTLGLERLLIKDESRRFDLPSFKILGASWAVYRILEERCTINLSDWQDIDDLRKYAEALPPITLVTATDGNHGRAVARVAAWLGFTARIFVPRGTVEERIDAIRGEGAAVIVVEGDYDTAVKTAAAEERTDCWLIQDTGWSGYETIPRWIMEGYTTIGVEIEEQLQSMEDLNPDCLIVQIGVGSLAAAMTAFYRHEHRKKVLTILGVEPEGADCALRSVQAGRLISTPGPYTSIMAGLNCGTVSSVAWPLIQNGIDLFVTVSNDHTIEAMKLLAGAGISSGESGAAGIAGLIEIKETAPHLMEELRLNGRVLAISTEGITDTGMYHRAIETQR